MLCPFLWVHNPKNVRTSKHQTALVSESEYDAFVAWKSSLAPTEPAVETETQPDPAPNTANLAAESALADDAAVKEKKQFVPLMYKYSKYLDDEHNRKKGLAIEAARKIVADLEDCFEHFDPAWIVTWKDGAQRLIVLPTYNFSKELETFDKDKDVLKIFADFAETHELDDATITRNDCTSAHCIHIIDDEQYEAKEWRIGQVNVMGSQKGMQNFRVHVNFTTEMLHIILDL